MKYEDKVRKICNFDEWETLENQEKQGAYGVACLMAYMRGVKPSLPDIAKHLGVTADEINVPFVRLLRNGAFHRDGWDAKNCPSLQGDQGFEEEHRIWAFVAAVASGYLGMPA